MTPPLITGSWIDVVHVNRRDGVYTVPGIMTSQRVCPGFGVPETEKLYRAYREYARLRGTEAQLRP